jgi:hypothetical protein
MIILNNNRLRITRNDYFIFSESYKIGNVESREATIKLIYDFEIIVDSDEIANISKDKSIIDAVSLIKTPESQYKQTDWRYKSQQIKTQILKDQPIVDRILSEHKDEVLSIIKDHMKPIPEQWSSLLLSTMQYKNDPKALQMQLDKDDNMYHVFGIVEMDLGSNTDGFLGRLVAEYHANYKSGDSFVTTLTGFNKMMNIMDPHHGTQLIHTKIDQHYDKEVRSGFIEQMSEALSYAAERIVFITSISDDGVITITTN